MMPPAPSSAAVRWFTKLVLGVSATVAAHLIQSHASARWVALLEPLSARAARGAATPLRPSSSVGRPSAPIAPQANRPGDSYHLDARLDTARHRISARGFIRWTNTSSKSQSELWLHLYLNAFRSKSTAFMRAPAAARRSPGPLGRPGGVDVIHLRSPQFGGIDLWQNADRHSPGDPGDATDIRVPLPSPLPPEATLELAIEFEAMLPELVERTGYSRDFYMAAQWFPKLARVQADGSWSHFSYHPQGEFDADFANYSVSLDVPREYVIGATGVRVHQERRGGRRIDHFEASNVHDFAWTAWPHFVEKSYRVAGVEVIHLFPPGHARAEATTRRTVELALPELGARYGEYPYPTLTVVHPPSSAAPACGMEYPTLITTGGAWYSPLLGHRTIEVVTAHELAHQWFYGIVASNEYRWPFLDEGLTTFAEMRVLESRWGAGSLFALGALRGSRLAQLRAFAANAPPESSAQPAPHFDGLAELGALAYARPAVALETIARTYGRARLEAALGSYARSHRFRHAEPADLLDAATVHIGRDASRALGLALLDGATINFRVARLEHSRNPGAGTITSRILVERHGTLALPVEVQLTDEAGSKASLHWDGSSASHWFEHRARSRIVQVVIDPNDKVLLDRSLIDNARSIEPSRLVGAQGLLALMAQGAVLGLSL